MACALRWLQQLVPPCAYNLDVRVVLALLIWCAARSGFQDVVICGAGIAGVSAAYHLTRLGVKNVVVISSHTPLTLTSAYSTECYRDYWPTCVSRL